MTSAVHNVRSPSRDEALIRLFDVAIACVALIFFLPLMILISLVVFISDPGPIVFGHQRLGQDGIAFRCLKFRSMIQDSDRKLAELLATDPVAKAEWAMFHKLSNDPRVTMFGRFLRKSSLDELPQLFNVLRGEMSLVGPRPITSEEAWRYGRYLKFYLHTKPGITGMWQVNGRSTTTYRRRVALDVLWCRNMTFKAYLGILFKTIPAVLLADGSI